ncbi:MAG: hypothetical protein HKN42_15155 [Granulosicoccus sp.]|nr:hypothetical protein [Granulosicoccus sp.]
MFRAGLLGAVLAGWLAGCGGSAGESLPETGVSPDNDDPAATPAEDLVARSDVRGLDRLYAYRQDSPYATVLRQCALIESSDDACSLDTLPFISQATPDFTREDIMHRVLVTHDWMGRHFESVLDDAPEGMITLFGALTSIVIGSTVRPSNYWTGTGGIQLDPGNLWLTIDEKANVSIQQDYRNDFGRDLQFWDIGTLREGNSPAIRYFSLTDRQERTLKDIRIPMYRLLYHELAHAVDYLPAASIATLDITMTPTDALFQNREFFLSPQLANELPLYSQTLYDLALVSFGGEQASELQTGLTPAYVGGEMAIDGAVRYYAYSTWREDFATLFATTLMKLEFNLDYYLAFVQKPQNEQHYSCSELTVGWGVKNRVADPLVSPRARWVLESVYGSTPGFDAFFATRLGTASPMITGVDWCTNRDGVRLTTGARARIDGAPDVDDRIQLEGERRQVVH